MSDTEKKDQKGVNVYFPESREDRIVAVKVLDNYIGQKQKEITAEEKLKIAAAKQ